MLTLLLPLVSSLIAATPAPVESGVDPVVDRSEGRAAQAHLAELLGDADSIDAIAGHGRTITFATRAHGHVFILAAQTTGGGAVRALRVDDRGPAGDDAPGTLAWLAAELDGAIAITALTRDDDGTVVIATSDGRRYAAIPGRGSGGPNAASEARWAAAWNDDRR